MKAELLKIYRKLKKRGLSAEREAAILAEINAALGKLENNTAWQVLIDKNPHTDPHTLELLYTIFRHKGSL